MGRRIIINKSLLKKGTRKKERISLIKDFEMIKNNYLKLEHHYKVVI
jgi:hypothetical protein